MSHFGKRWGQIQADTLVAPGADVDAVLDTIGEQIVRQHRPAHKAVVWGALVAMGPARGQDATWDARRMRFLDQCLVAARHQQDVRTLVALNLDQRVGNRLRDSLAYCADKAGNRQDKFKREAVGRLMIRAVRTIDHNVPEALIVLETLVDLAGESVDTLPWLHMWADARMQMSGGKNDGALLAHLVARGIDVNTCDRPNDPILGWLGRQRQNAQVARAAEELLTVGLDWSRPAQHTPLIQQVVETHPVVRRARLTAGVKATTTQARRANRM